MGGINDIKKDIKSHIMMAIQYTLQYESQSTTEFQLLGITNGEGAVFNGQSGPFLMAVKSESNSPVSSRTPNPYQTCPFLLSLPKTRLTDSTTTVPRIFTNVSNI